MKWDSEPSQTVLRYFHRPVRVYRVEVVYEGTQEAARPVAKPDNLYVLTWQVTRKEGDERSGGFVFVVRVFCSCG